MRKIFGVLLVLGGIAIGACVAPEVGLTPKPSIAETPAQPTAWEYMFVEDSTEPFKYHTATDANALGSQGWELVGTGIKNGNYKYFYKRRKS